MKKFFTIVFLLVAIFILILILRSGILPSIDNALGKALQKGTVSGSEFKTKEECIKNKGDWGKAGLFPQEFCRIPLSDFAKTCIAGLQCQAGVCSAQFQFRNNPILTIGKCPKYVTIFGCTQEVHFGFTSQAICRD